MELRWYQEEAVKAMMTSPLNGIAVLPTGAGKTIVIAEFVKRYKGKILIISHVREILEQNFTTLVRYLDDDVSMYSAGWGMRDVGHVTVGGIQSIYKKPELFKDVSMVLVDECHLINNRNSGMYRQFLDALNPRVLGLTATPFRLGQGYLHIDPDSVFKTICYDLSEQIPRLQDEGYLSILKSKAPEEQMDTTDLRTVGGDFSQADMDEKYADEESTWEAVQTLEQYKHYKKLLIFCVNIKHAEMVAEMLGKLGITALPVHSKLSTEDRDEALNKFKAGDIQALTNVNVLTTGFDAPDIDCIVMLRPTKSAGLYSQMVGRGLRVAPNKDHCLILDYAGNIARLGPINNLRIDRKGKLEGNGLPPVKVCDHCRMYIPLSARLCPECGADVAPDPSANIEATASTLELVEKEGPVRWWPVAQVTYARHKKIGAPDSVKISYLCGARVFREWLCIEHTNRAGFVAKYKLQNRWQGPTKPTTVEEFLSESHLYQTPSEISVDTSGKYPQIVDKKYIFEKSA